MQDLLLEVQTSAGDVDVGSLTVVLASAAHSDDDAIRLTALRWLRTFVMDARAALLPRYPLVLSAVLPALAPGPPGIVQACRWDLSASDPPVMPVCSTIEHGSRQECMVASEMTRAVTLRSHEQTY